MEIITIIIACLTLICVGIGLFLNHSNNQKLAERLAAYEEKVSESISIAKNDLIKEFQSKIGSLSGEAKESFEKASHEMRSKIDDAIQSYDKQQGEMINEVKTKFSKIIEEIKNPLTID